MKKTLLALTVAATLVLGTAAAAFGVTATMGNAVTDRALRDTFANFTIVDTNNSAPFDGTFTTVTYFAERVDIIRFVVVHPSGEVTWVSEEITPGAVGVNTYSAPGPVGVVAGSNLGVYSKNAGVVSYDLNPAADPAFFEHNNAGLPVEGETLTYQSSSDRYYSMIASVQAASPDICKDGGWETYGYKNQGQCIASVVANDSADK